MICKKCRKEFYEDWRKDRGAKKTPCKFCSRKCSNSRERSKEVREKLSNSLTKYFELHPKEKSLIKEKKIKNKKTEEVKNLQNVLYVRNHFIYG